jgi:hypothetical protein
MLPHGIRGCALFDVYDRIREAKAAPADSKPGAGTGEAPIAALVRGVPTAIEDSK